MRGSRTRPGILRRSATVSLVGAVLAALPMSVVASTALASTRAASPAPTKSVAALLDASTATAKAEATGQPVEVTALTSPTQIAIAQPNGQVTATFTAEPVRAQAPDGSWVPVDTTIAATNGQVVPKAATVPIAFSNGGSTAPLASIARDGATYQVYSPWPLPVPELSGSSATYHSVQPGVDIVVVAEADGFSDNVVITDATAAANPALSAITFPVRLSGLRQVQDPASGTVNEVDAQGRPVFSCDAPSMWDSRGASVASSAAAVVAPPATAKSTTMSSSVTDASVTIRPDHDMLTSPETTFPVVLDPVTKTSSLTGWTVLDRQFHKNAYWKDSPDPDGLLSVGYDGYDTGSLRQSVVQFSTSALAGKKILGATFTAFEVWSANCTKHEVDLYRTTSINSSSSWDKHPSWQDKVDSQTVAHGWTGSSACSAQAPVEFKATDAVTYTAGQSSSTTTLGMKVLAADESNALAWKQFAKPSGSHIPTLSVTYLSNPPVPTSVKLATPNLSCATSATSPTWIATTTPRLQAKLSDADGSSSTLRANFEVYAGSTKTWSQTPSGTVASGAIVYATTSALKTNTLYYYHARTQYDWSYSGLSGSVYSGWSGNCYFEIDTTAPAPPNATTATYAPCATPDDPDSCPVSGGVGQPATFTFTGSADAKTFLYTLNSGIQVTAAATASGTTATSATVTINPNVRGLNILQVVARDAAGNVSQTYEYDFAVAAGTPAVGVWNLDEGSGTSLTDSTTRGTAHPATINGGVTWTGTGRSGTSAVLDGATGYAETTGPVVNTATSFSVSGWVRLSGHTANTTVVSQRGVHEAGFDLYYSTIYGWVFSMISADNTATNTIVRATSPASPALFVWTHLTGVYDAVAKTITLYVNGVPGPATGYTTPWNATGPMDIGRRWYNDAWGEFAYARVDRVAAWDRVLSPQEIDDDDEVLDPATGLATPDVVRDWPVTETAGPTIADVSGYGHNLTMAGAGASIVSDPVRGQALALDGTSGYATASTAAVDAQGSFTATAWVNPSSAGLGTAARTAQVFAQSGTNQSTWGLWYSQTAAQAGNGFWYFGTTSADTSSASTTAIASLGPADVDNWEMLSIVYDAPDHELNLYINGYWQGGLTVNLPWQAGGVLAVGRGLAGGTWGRYFPGSIDDVTIAAGVTSQQALLAQYSAQVA